MIAADQQFWAVRPPLISFIHPELSQGACWFDRIEPDSFRWFRAFFARPSNTALPAVRVSRIGNDRAGHAARRAVNGSCSM